MYIGNGINLNVSLLLNNEFETSVLLNIVVPECHCGLVRHTVLHSEYGRMSVYFPWIIC